MSKRRAAKFDADRQAAIEKLGELYLEFAASPEGVRYLEAQHAALVEPRNDADYVKAALARDKEREGAANEIAIVHHVVEWGRNYLALTLKNDRDRAKARQVAAILQRHFEAEGRYHEDEHDKTRAADRKQATAPRHDFGREKRSLRSK